MEATNSNKNRCCVIKRDFSLGELKLIIDAVGSSKSIPQETSQDLINRLSTLAGSFRAGELQRNVVVEGRAKTATDPFWAADNIHSAITEGKKVSFHYFSYNEKKDVVVHNDGEPYIVSPYNLVWNGDYYYLVGFSDTHNEIRTFRVDRILDTPVILDDDLVPAPADFDIETLLYTNFRMFNAPVKTVELSCDNSVAPWIIDKFGIDVAMQPKRNKTFRVKVNVAVSPAFFGWVFGFEGKIRITAPASVKKKYQAALSNALEKA